MPGAPQNPKRAAATITTLYSPETAKKIKNQWKPNISPFPLIPTKATTTTKLAQKLENIRNQWKPCSTSQLLRRQNVEDMILALLDPIWLCLNMCPALQGGSPCSAACAQLITAAYLSLEKTIPVSFCQKLFQNPIYLIEFMFFFDVTVCQNNTLLFWGMLTGACPQGIPHHKVKVDVPCLPRKVKVDVAKCHACHAKRPVP